jgi:hypothetical protein
MGVPILNIILWNGYAIDPEHSCDRQKRQRVRCCPLTGVASWMPPARVAPADAPRPWSRLARTVAAGNAPLAFRLFWTTIALLLRSGRRIRHASGGTFRARDI